MNSGYRAILSFLGIITCVFVLLFGESCQDPIHRDRDARPWISPELPTVLVYQDLINERQEYWLYEEIGPGQIRKSQWLDDSGIKQAQVLSLLGDAIVLDRMLLQYGNRYLEADIRSDDVFSTDALDTNLVLIQHMIFWEAEDSSRFTEISMNHRFREAFGDSLLVFHSAEMIEHFDDGFVESKALSVRLYQKETGLVTFQKYRENELVSHLQLVDLCPPSEFNERYGFDVPSTSFMR